MGKTFLKDIPSVNKVMLQLKNNINLHQTYLKKIIQKEIEIIRKDVKNGYLNKSKDELLIDIKQKVLNKSSSKLLNLINGTGIVLHTGFGRAPYRSESLKNIAKRMEGYIALEYDIENGKRGDRQDHVREFLSSVCESESSLVVNNNAAAVLLSINGLANGGEVIVSRGELVEIGGSFRIPDIIKASGATLREVGTTNRTHFQDYKNAINKNTKLILTVHTSNYIIKGFTKSVKLGELVSLGKKNTIPVMVDWGSGSLVSDIPNNTSLDIPINKLMKSKPDIITFSGDKLIGGPQSGIIVGKKSIIDLFQTNTLYRTLRPDKLTIALLEEILRSYNIDTFTDDNLSLSLLSSSRRSLTERGNKVMNLIQKSKVKDYGIKLIESKVEAGSGSLPEKKISSMAIVFESKSIKCSVLAKKFRKGKIPVVGYMKDNKFYIDLKAVLPNQLIKLSQAINSV